MKQRFSSTVAMLCTEKSIMRQWLSDSFVVAYIEPDKIYVHIAVMYFRPMRPTFLRLENQGLTKFGRLQLHARFRENDHLEVVTDSSFFADMCKDESVKRVKLLKLCCLDRVTANFTPGDNILVTNIPDQYVGKHGDTATFWSGATDEKKKFDAKGRRRKEFAKRYQARRTAMGEGRGHRSGQSNHAGGLRDRGGGNGKRNKILWKMTADVLQKKPLKLD